MKLNDSYYRWHCGLMLGAATELVRLGQTIHGLHCLKLFFKDFKKIKNPSVDDTYWFQVAQDTQERATVDIGEDEGEVE